VSFYRSGAIRSITLFPGEVITVRTAQGEVAAPLAESGFSVIPYTGLSLGCNPTDCANCSLACA
jgi:hypothetical protein